MPPFLRSQLQGPLLGEASATLAGGSLPLLCVRARYLFNARISVYSDPASLPLRLMVFLGGLEQYFPLASFSGLKSLMEMGVY